MLKGIQGASDDFFGEHSDFPTSVFFCHPLSMRVPMPTPQPTFHTIWNISYMWVLLAGCFVPWAAALRRVPGSDSSGILSSMGMQFLNNQLKDKDSKYRMPLKNAAEKQWEDWFDRVEQLPQLYPGLSAQLVIPALLGHVSAEDGRILGWHEVSREAHAKGETVSLLQNSLPMSESKCSQLAQHVRVQPLSFRLCPVSLMLLRTVRH